MIISDCHGIALFRILLKFSTNTGHSSLFEMQKKSLEKVGNFLFFILGIRENHASTFVENGEKLNSSTQFFILFFLGMMAVNWLD